MKTTNAKFPFSYQRKEYLAQVSMMSPDKPVPQLKTIEFNPEKTPMVRVRVETGRKEEHIFIFWKVKPGHLFWHDLKGEFKKGMAKKIANTLLESM